ncbi:hypothetical protein [Pseudoclavibacter helvolus]|uniref:hypothetical protein n=1 Tax=Pseudoclavibacter helvolus TaxID=255205 RepID=UPI0012E8B5C2|nr:hypothetical protein [Pseudoclavibacter helvolus]
MADPEAINLLLASLTADSRAKLLLVSAALLGFLSGVMELGWSPADQTGLFYAKALIAAVVASLAWTGGKFVERGATLRALYERRVLDLIDLNIASPLADKITAREELRANGESTKKRTRAASWFFTCPQDSPLRSQLRAQHHSLLSGARSRFAWSIILTLVTLTYVILVANALSSQIRFDGPQAIASAWPNLIIIAVLVEPARRSLAYAKSKRAILKDVEIAMQSENLPPTLIDVNQARIEMMRKNRVVVPTVVHSSIELFTSKQLSRSCD